MPPPPRKKLIEVALPLKAINEAAAREKSIRHGHPSTLHLWWARRPLAACRAVLFASLVDDPDSDPDYQDAKGQPIEERSAAARTRLFRLIEELVQWENSNDRAVLHSARAEIARCVASRLVETGQLKRTDVIHGTTTVADIITKGACRPMLRQNKKPKERDWYFDTKPLPPFDAVNAFLAAHAPPVLDPFCGGGSIPLEAQRLGLRAFASDLNPVPVLITKALIEIPPKFAGRPPVNPAWQAKSDAEKKLTVWEGAKGLADDVRYYGQWMRDEAEKRIGHLYPKVAVTKELAKNRPDLKNYVGQDLTVIAWLWARTVECPNPGCRARMPLIRSFWLSTKKGKASYAKPILDHENKTVRFEIACTGEPPVHTTDRNGARCLFCETFVKKGPLHEIAVAHGVQEIPLAIVAEGKNNRVYLSGDSIPHPKLKKPDVAFLEQPMTNDRRWFSPPLYGLPNFADLFTSRQLVALTTFSDLVQEARDKVLIDAKLANISDDQTALADGGSGAVAYADAVAVYLAFGIDRSADFWCSLCTWANQPKNELVAHVFGRQALPMVWDFAEANPFSDSGGNYTKNCDFINKAIVASPPFAIPGTVKQVDATALASQWSTCVVSTDPPYYDNIGYADLSDFFYVWLRRTLRTTFPSLCATALTPKQQELIASPNRHEGGAEEAKSFFEHGLQQVFSAIRGHNTPEVPFTVFYAFKQAEDDDSPEDSGSVTTASSGWETM